jgi:hydroxymethylglutaryl-CoA synthase
MAGIEALGFYFPRYSIKAEEYVRTWGRFAARGVKEKTVAGYDEDQVTMALEAARKVLRGTDVGYLATATFDGPRMSGTLASALGLEAIRKADFSSSTNASGEALLSCLDYVESSGRRALMVAADMPMASPEDPGEHGLGAGAVSVLISSNGGLQVVDVASQVEEEYGELFLDEGGRRRSMEVTDLSSRAIRGSVETLLGSLKGDFRVACHEPDGRFARRALKGLVDPSNLGGGVVELSGDTGCSSPLLALMEALSQSKVGESLLLVTYGGGSSVGISFRLVDKPMNLESPRKALSSERRYLSYLQYAQFRRFLSSQRTDAEVSQGAYISIPAYMESLEQRYRLLASRCTSCNRLYFPPRQACLSCGGRTFDSEPLSGKGEIHAHTLIARGSAPTEFREQQDLIGEYVVALVQLREGPRIVAQLTDCDPDEVSIGLPVEFVVRRIYSQEGVVRYGYKFRPALPRTRNSRGT